MARAAEDHLSVGQGYPPERCKTPQSYCKYSIYSRELMHQMLEKSLLGCQMLEM